MMKLFFIIVLAVTFVSAGATENYIKYNDNRIDSIIKSKLESLDNMMANHFMGACISENATSGAYIPAVACADGSDDIAVVTCEAVINGVISSISATAEVYALTGNLTSFDTVEAGDECNLLLEYDGTSFYVTQGTSVDSTEVAVIPSATDGRCPMAIINIVVDAGGDWVPGDNWNDTGVTTTVRVCWFRELVY